MAPQLDALDAVDARTRSAPAAREPQASSTSAISRWRALGRRSFRSARFGKARVGRRAAIVSSLARRNRARHRVSDVEEHRLAFALHVDVEGVAHLPAFFTAL